MLAALGKGEGIFSISFKYEFLKLYISTVTKCQITVRRAWLRRHRIVPHSASTSATVYVEYEDSEIGEVRTKSDSASCHRVI